MASATRQKIGLISDTHGLLRPEALQALAGCDFILHAGDVGKPEVLTSLRAIAPVTAVRGNVDRGSWADALPETETFTLAGVTVHMLHDLATLDILPQPDAGWVVISGHSHQPSVEERDGVLWVNPGSAGPRRFRLPVTVGILEVARGRAAASLIELDVPAPGTQGVKK